MNQNNGAVMKKLSITLFLSMLISTASAFTVCNNTKYMLKVNIDKDAWWYSVNYKVIPQQRDFGTMQFLETGEYTKFIISINYYKNKKAASEQWHIFDLAQSQFEVKQEDESFVLFVNGERVA